MDFVDLIAPRSQYETQESVVLLAESAVKQDDVVHDAITRDPEPCRLSPVPNTMRLIAPRLPGRLPGLLPGSIDPVYPPRTRSAL